MVEFLNQVWRYAAGIFAAIIVADVLSFIKPYAISVTKGLVAWSEKKYADEPKSGLKKKHFVMAILRFIFIGLNKQTPIIIDAIVTVANEKSTEMTTALKSVTTAEVNAKLTKLSSGSGKV
jgi:hypothetical protein